MYCKKLLSIRLSCISKECYHMDLLKNSFKDSTNENKFKTQLVLLTVSKISSTIVFRKLEWPLLYYISLLVMALHS